MKKINKKGFTLIELIVTIIIIIILSTVGFLYYSEFYSNSRDTNRILQLTEIGNGLENYGMTNKLPLPENNLEIKIGTKIIAYQGDIGKDILDIINFKGEGLDPLLNEPFTYYLTENKKNYQLMALLENEENLKDTKKTVNIFNQTYAENYILRYPKVYGKKLGLLTGNEENFNIPINKIKNGSIDIAITNDEYIAHLSDYSVIIGTGSTLKYLENIVKSEGVDINCNFLLARNKSLFGQNGIYVIDPEGNNPLVVYCDMTTDGGGWTLYSRKDSSGYFVNDLGKEYLKNITDIFYRYRRKHTGDDLYAFKFKKFYTKQCGQEHGNKNDIVEALRDYIDHIENMSWGSCGRDSTPGDENDIEVKKIINSTFKDDPCLTGTLKKTDSRNFTWGNTTTSDGKTIGSLGHRISNRTVLFGNDGRGSNRCDGVSDNSKETSEVYLFVK